MLDKALTLAEKHGMFDRAAEEVLVDFDGTLCEFKYPDMGEPIPGARYFMQALIRRGLKPVVWSSRMTPQIYTEDERAVSIKRIADWLHEHRIPHHAIDTGNSGKRLCLAYVDDRGVHASRNWDRVLHHIDDIRGRVEVANVKRRARHGQSDPSGA